MARLAFAQGRDTAAERYMVLLGKTYRHFVEPDQPEHDPAADLETVRQLVQRLVAAGELDLSDLTGGGQRTALAPATSRRSTAAIATSSMAISRCRVSDLRRVAQR